MIYTLLPVVMTQRAGMAVTSPLIWCHVKVALSYIPCNLPLEDMMPRLCVCLVDRTGGTQQKQLTKGR